MIVQGYNGGTHQGVERFALDLVLQGAETSGAAVLAPASGTVAWSDFPGSNSGCFAIEIRDGGGLFVMLCHLLLNPPLADGAAIERGQRVGIVGPPGLVRNNGLAHIHMAVYRLPGGVRTPVPFALPEGAPLDGNSMPSSGSPGQWGCPTYPTCPAMTSSNSPGAPAPTSTPPSGASAGTPMVVQGTGSCLRMHESPGLATRVTGCLPDGTAVSVVEGPHKVDGLDWSRINFGGWVDAGYLAKPGATPTASQPATMASVPACNGDEQMTFDPVQPLAGQTLTVLVTSARPSTNVTLTGPVPVQFVAATGGGKGTLWSWAATPADAARYDFNFMLAGSVCTTNFIQVGPAPVAIPPIPAPALPAAAPALVAASNSLTAVVSTGADCLNVRDTPSLGGTIVDCLADGTRVTLTGQTQAADGYTWAQIEGLGWAVSDYLKP